MPARARWSHQWSLRALLALGLVVPLVCLLGLWLFGTEVTMRRAGAEHDFATADQLYTGPTRALSAALAAEQLQAVTWLIAAEHAPLLGSLQARFRATDRAAASFVAAARADAAAIPGAARPELRLVESLLAGRVALRASVRASRLNVPAAVGGYGAILSAVVSFEAKLLVADDGSLTRQAAATVEADRGVALVSGEVTLASRAVEKSGEMTAAERVLFVQDAARARLTLNEALTVLDPVLASGYLRARSSAAYRAFAAVENQIAARVGHSGHLPEGTVALAASSTAPLTADYQAAQLQDATGLASLAAQASGSATLAVVLVAGLGLVAVLLSVALATWLWWRIVRDVTRLQRAAHWVGDERLRQLAETEQPGAGATDSTAATASSKASLVREFARATAALSAAQQLALQAVTAQNQLRSGASEFLRHLAERSHALARRQLRLLAVVERGTTDPQPLAGLAALGQLSTRLQRQADGLLALSGGSPGRTDVAALPISDLLRAVAAAVDDGSRIAVVSSTHDEVAADAVADVLHLITELAENAVQHTPPLTDVSIRAGRVGRGLAIEVEDHGPGFAEEHLESANALLAQPPDMGLPAGAGLGLLVTARLAERHGITVSLRRSPPDGTTAIVVLPHALLITAEGRDTIFDGSLPRIDAPTAPPALASPVSPATPLPAVSLPPPGLPPPGPPEPAAPAPAAPAAENPSPWHWLSESQSTRTSAPESTGIEVGAPKAGDLDTPTPLPRRIPLTSPPVEQGGSAAPASGGPDQTPAAGAADGDPGNGPDAVLADEH